MLRVRRITDPTGFIFQNVSGRSVSVSRRAAGRLHSVGKRNILFCLIRNRVRIEGAMLVSKAT